MEKNATVKEKKAREIINQIISRSHSEQEANLKLLQSNNYDDENTVNRLTKLMYDERLPNCQYLEDYFRGQSNYAYLNSKFDLRPKLLNNLEKGIPNRLGRKVEQVDSDWLT